MARLPKSKDTSSVKSGLTLKSNHSPASSSASGHANRSDNGTNVTLNTLSMISSPWTTESGFTPMECFTQSFSSLTTSSYNFSSSSADPQTTTASSVLSLQSFASHPTITLLSPATSYQSVQICVPNKQSASTVSSWTVETFTSEGIIFSDNSHSRNVGVKGPLSPVSSGTDYYPCSSDTPVSRKGSRASISPGSSKQEEYFFPINYIKEITLNSQSDHHLGLDWSFAKKHGIPIVISVPI